MSTALPPLSVLLVDNSRGVSDGAADALGLADHTVHFARCGDDALHRAAVNPPDVVILDLRMPGLDECKTARQIVTRQPGKPPLLIAVADRGTDADRERTAAWGFHLHLVKPVDPAVVAVLLRRVQRTLAPPVSVTHSSPPLGATPPSGFARNPREAGDAHSR